MISDFVNSTWQQLKSQPVLSSISLIGTALSIFLIMVVVMLQQVKTAPFSPESNRSRFLHVTNNSIKQTQDMGWESNGPYSEELARHLMGEMKTPEKITLYSTKAANPSNIKTYGNLSTTGDILATDANFFKVFDFNFIEGKPYDQAMFDSHQQVVVIVKSIADELFGNAENTIDKEVLIDYVPYRIIGVVKDVSTLADHAYAQIWIPYSSNNSYLNSWDGNGLMGNIRATILAKSPEDFDLIRNEFENNVRKHNKNIESTGWQIISRGRPYTQEKESIGAWANIEPDLESSRLTHLIVYVILLLVPAINLSSMTESRLKRRAEEIGIRRAFGCSRLRIFLSLVWENLLITIVAGLAGWILSVIFAWLCTSFLFAPEFNLDSIAPSVDFDMLVQLPTFLWALFFCFILNLLSSGIPAFRAARTNIVNALK